MQTDTLVSTAAPQVSDEQRQKRNRKFTQNVKLLGLYNIFETATQVRKMPSCCRQYQPDNALDWLVHIMLMLPVYYWLCLQRHYRKATVCTWRAIRPNHIPCNELCTCAVTSICILFMILFAGCGPHRDWHPVSGQHFSCHHSRRPIVTSHMVPCRLAGVGHAVLRRRRQLLVSEAV